MAPKKLPDQAYLRQCFDYNPDTGDLTWKIRARSHFPTQRGWKKFNTSYAGTIAGVTVKGVRFSHIIVCINGVKFLAHRLIWKILTNEEPPEVDHRDGNEMNNRKGNLRASDRPTNAQNAKRHSDKSNPLKGAYQNGNSWESKIMVEGKLHRLGHFHTPEEAHAAYCEAATRLHGEFANFGEDRQRTSP